MAVEALHGIDHSQAAFSSRGLATLLQSGEVQAPSHIISVEQIERNTELLFQGGDIFDRLKHETAMAIDSSVSVKETENIVTPGLPVIEKEQQNEHISSSKGIPEAFLINMPADESVEFVHLPRIPQKVEVIGQVADEQGNVIEQVQGLVVGRTRKDIVTEEGEEMVEVATYARNDHLTNFSKIAREGVTIEEVLGATGDEVKVTRRLSKEEAAKLEYSGYWVELKEHFGEDGIRDYHAQAPLKERMEWLGSKEDETGKTVGIEGSVIGRDGQEVMLISRGGYTEKQTREIIYVRWDSQHPNRDLLHIPGAQSHLVKGSTGIEVEIIRYTKWEGAYPAKDFSGWYETKDGKLEVIDQRVAVTEQQKIDEELQVDPDMLVNAPISIKTVPSYPSVEAKELVEKMAREAISENTIPILVAENYSSFPGIAGYLHTNAEKTDGRNISAIKNAYTGELYFDEDTKTRMVRTAAHFRKDPGNMSLAELAKRENFEEVTNKNGEREYVVKNVVTLEEAVKQGYVFSKFVDTTQSAAPLALAA